MGTSSVCTYVCTLFYITKRKNDALPYLHRFLYLHSFFALSPYLFLCLPQSHAALSLYLSFSLPSALSPYLFLCLPQSQLCLSISLSLSPLLCLPICFFVFLRASSVSISLSFSLPLSFPGAVSKKPLCCVSPLKSKLKSGHKLPFSRHNRRFPNQIFSPLYHVYSGRFNLDRFTADFIRYRAF
jgi:hypothetical protein